MALNQLKPGWYKCGKKFHYFTFGGYGQGFISFCGLRNFVGEREEIVRSLDKCWFCVKRV